MTTLDTAAPYAPPDGIRPFLATIAERPDDMGPRLVFADWLEEQGDPWGEFLRVGVDLAKFSPDDWQARCNAGTLPPDHPISKRAKSAYGLSEEMLDRLLAYYHKKDTLTARHNELLARHGAAWASIVLGGVWPDHVVKADRVFSARIAGYPNVATFHWHGGLPADFTLPLDAWMGQRCDLCEGAGVVRAYSLKRDGRLLPNGKEQCPDCAGTGRVNAIGPKLLAAAPVRVEGLRFSGKQPYHARDMLHFWWHRVPSDFPEEIDPDLFDMLDGFVRSHDTGKAYPDLAAAHNALARAAIAWAMQLKGATASQ